MARRFAAPATINLAASVTTNGHTINAVQFYNGATLLGTATTPPYTGAWTNVPVGTYTLFAQVIFDTNSTNTSAPIIVTANPLPAAPQNLSVTALASNFVTLTGPRSVNAGGYLLQRNGVAIATLATTAYQDFGLAPNTTYCYSVVGTNLWGVGNTERDQLRDHFCRRSAPWCGMRTHPPRAPRTAVATGAAAAPTGGTAPTDVAWSDGSVAVFGAGTGSGGVVTLLNNVTPGALVFEADGGFDYSIAGSYNLILSGTVTLEADGGAAISAILQGTGGLLKTGQGTLTLSAANTFSGSTTVSGGTLSLNAWQAMDSSALTIASGATVVAVAAECAPGTTTKP